MKAVICLLVSLAILCSAQYNPQVGPLSVQMIQPGVTVVDSLPAATSSSAYHVESYSFFVPENTSSVTISFYDINTSACNFLHLYFRTSGLPCATQDYPTSSWFCSNGFDPNDAVTSYNDVQFPGYQSDMFEYVAGGYWYFGIGRYSGSSPGNVCPYNLTLSLSGVCNVANSVGIAAGLSTSATTAVCSVYTTVPNTGSNTYTIQNGAADTYNTYKMDVPMGVGQILVVVISSSSGAEMYGKQYGTPSTSNYECYDSTASSTGNGTYILQLNCYVPRSGSFYWVFYDTDNVYNATIQFSVTQCGAGQGGFACGYPLVAMNTTALATTPLQITVPYQSTGQLFYGQWIGYVDVPAMYAGPDVYITVSTPSSSAYLLTRVNGFPEYNSPYGYETSSEVQNFGGTSDFGTWGLSAFDYYTGGRFFFALVCSSSSAGECNFTMSANASTYSTTGSVSSGPMSTTGSGTVNTTGTVSTTGSQTSVNTTSMITTGPRNTTNGVSTTGSGAMATTMSGSATSTTGEQNSSGFEVLVPSVIFAVTMVVSLMF